MTKVWLKILATVSIVLLLATNLGCKKDDLRTLGAIVVVAVAAKLIYDMVIEHETQQVTNEKDVIKKYKKLHKDLPPEPTVIAYNSSIQPGDVVNVGKDISIVSRLEVVRGVGSQTLEIQEKIMIFDNEDNSKEIKSLTKTVNEETGRSGEFANEFKFKLPKGMPQGVYPIKTQVIIDGKAQPPVENKMQLVLHNVEDYQHQLIAAF